MGKQSDSLNLALQLHQSGRVQEAIDIYRKLVRKQPANAQLLFLLGVANAQTGQVEMAIELLKRALIFDNANPFAHFNLGRAYQDAQHLEKALASYDKTVTLKPDYVEAYYNRGIVLADLKRLDEALVSYDKVLALKSDYVEAYYNRGNALQDLKRLDEALASYDKALALKPDFAEAYHNRGGVLQDLRRLDEAVASYDKALALKPGDFETCNNRGNALKDLKRLDEAIASYDQALALKPDYAEAYYNRGNALIDLERFDEALESYDKALALKPDYAEALYNLGLVRVKQERLDEAIAPLQRSLQLRADFPEALVVLGIVLAEQGKPAQAEAAYLQALHIDPQMAGALAGLGKLRLQEGKIDESVRLLEQALTIDPDNIDARFHLTKARKVTPDDANLAALEAQLPEINGWMTEKRVTFHYALGKAYDDLKEWDKAFPHFLEGARLKRSKLNYNAAADAARTQRIAEVVDRPFIERMSGTGNPSDVPVFVLGMPRSGTTLTEQIIASHPDVFGAGELRDLMEVVQFSGQPYPENVPSIDHTTLTIWGDEYVRRLRERAPEAKRITDKMPANYFALGLIPLMLPNARIIHVKRNPVDTCVSCFMQLFNRHQGATFDLYELGRHYANYARLMNHWRTVLPAHTFMEVQYEDIVADMESQARRLIDWVGLEWNDACLAFHKSERNIRTASIAQVRQPIYNSSMERWRNYEKFLGPLLEGLGEFR